jgi:hypothetical protein
MTTFHPQPSDCGRRARRKADTNVLQIHVTNCAAKLHGPLHEARKIRCNNFQGAEQAHVTEWSFYPSHALPLPRARILRLAQISPMDVRSPARRPNNGRETSDKTSGELSRDKVAQFPSNNQTMTNVMPLNIRQDDSQDHLPYTGLGHAIAAPETCKTTRNMTAQRSMQQLTNDSWESCHQLLIMTSKNYEHSN